MDIQQLLELKCLTIEESQFLGLALGTNVSRLRVDQNITKKTFALMSGISRPLLDRIESGNSDVRLSYLQRLADALCVEPTELLVVSCNKSTTRHGKQRF